MSRIAASSGARYSAHKETARRFEPIAPVGTNYVPVGRPDIGAMRSAAAAKPPAPPSTPAAARPVPGAPRAVPAAGFGRAPVVNRTTAPDDDWELSAPAATPPPPPPVANRPPVAVSTRPTPAVSQVRSDQQLSVYIMLFRRRRFRLLRLLPLLTRQQNLLRKTALDLWALPILPLSCSPRGL